MRKAAVASLVLIILCPGIAHPLKVQRSLDIYFIDVEGGAATLVVTPQHESVLIDTGWKSPDDRDAKLSTTSRPDWRDSGKSTI